MPPVFVDAHDLAELLGVAYGTVLTWTRRGKIPHVRDGRRRLLFNLDRVLVALKARECTPLEVNIEREDSDAG